MKEIITTIPIADIRKALDIAEEYTIPFIICKMDEDDIRAGVLLPNPDKVTKNIVVFLIGFNGHAGIISEPAKSIVRKYGKHAWYFYPEDGGIIYQNGDLPEADDNADARRELAELREHHEAEEKAFMERHEAEGRKITELEAKLK